MKSLSTLCASLVVFHEEIKKVSNMILSLRNIFTPSSSDKRRCFTLCGCSRSAMKRDHPVSIKCMNAYVNIVLSNNSYGLSLTCFETNYVVSFPFC